MIIILVIALLIFGKRLPEVMRSLGKGISEFKRGMNDVANGVGQDQMHAPAPQQPMHPTMQPAQPIQPVAPLPPVQPVAPVQSVPYNLPQIAGLAEKDISAPPAAPESAPAPMTAEQAPPKTL
jgi:sec-independent protein translocase protein TatA